MEIHGGDLDMFSFQFMGRRLSFVWAGAALGLGLERVFQFVDEDHARRFLEDHVVPGEPMLKLRALLDGTPHSSGERYPQEHEVVQMLARHLARGALLVVDGAARQRTLGGGGAPKPPFPSKPPPPQPGKPPPPKAAKSFEVRYVDEIGQPIPGVAVELDVGGKHTRVTDGAGHVRLDGVREDYGAVKATDLAALRGAAASTLGPASRGGVAPAAARSHLRRSPVGT